jgi:hypothetical protein
VAVTFIVRPQGSTLRRRLTLEAMHAPHPGSDRFEEDFNVAMHCSKCGKLGYGPRVTMREAIQEHLENDCPARKTKEDEPQVTRLFYPKQ